MQRVASFVLILLTTTLLMAQVDNTQAYATPGAKPFPKLPYSSPTSKERMEWFLKTTVGPASLTAGVVSAGWGTLLNQPKEYGTHWDGFAQRYGMRLTGIATGNAMEASLGALWGEDPRYLRVAERPFKNRVWHVMKMTVTATNRDGIRVPAYARFIAIPGSNFLSNTWRADSEATINRAALRTIYGFLSRMSGNAWEEFWPDAKQRILKRDSRTP